MLSNTQERKLTKRELQQMKLEEEKLNKERELRNKAWEDLKIDEKIERIREIIKNDQERNNRNWSELHRKVNKLNQHSHKDNEIVVPLKEIGYGLGGCEESAKRADGKVWF